MSYTSAQAQSYSPESQDLVYYSADLINADLITEVAELKGNVKILFGDYELTAKNASLSKKTQTLKAWGDVKIESSNSFVEADQVEMNYQKKEGVLTGVRLTSGQLLLEAESINKISDEVYVANRARFTTCTTCPPAWRVKSKKIITNINKYIDVRGGRFQILNQSILPLPRVVFPLNTRRKTGLLPPSITNAPGRTGTEFAQPFFWAINPHKDLTFTPMFYTSDISKVTGGKLHLEYNEWLSDKSKLKLRTAYMYDDSYQDTAGVSLPTSRWFLHYTNFFVLPRDVVQKTDFSFIREREYLNDFIPEIYGRGEAALKNSFSISKTLKNQFTSAEVIFYKNLLVEDPFDSDNTSIQKLPELRYSVTETPILKKTLLFKLDSVYTNFYRSNQSFDTVTPSSDPLAPKSITSTASLNFDPSQDLIRTGHRLKFNYEVSKPFKIGKTFDFLPKINLKDSYYKFDVDEKSITSSTKYSNYAHSRYLEGSLAMRTEFSKVYRGKYKHKIVPQITGRYGGKIDRSKSSFFDNQGDLPYHRQYQPITDDDFFNFTHGVQFDYWDRFFRAEVAELSLTNIIIKKNKQDFVTYYDQPFYLNLTQSYDFRNARLSATPDPWSNLDGALKIKTKGFTNLTQSSYFYKSKRLNITTRSRLNYRPGSFFSFGYSDFITVDAKGDLTKNRTKNVDFGLGWEFPSIKLSGVLAYSLLEKRQLGWKSDLLITPRGNCWGLKLTLSQLAGRDKDIGYKIGFFFNFNAEVIKKRSLLNI